MQNTLSSSVRAPAYLGRILIAFTLLAITAYIFWVQSRFPQLNDKALMGGAATLQDSLSFEAKYPLDPSWPLWKRIGYSSINWVYTNRRGMLFGVLFGALFLTLLRYIPKRGFKNSYLNAILGLMIGAPLGVCVNCASPIAAGMYQGGSRAETTLAAMIASPTFNAIVLSMLFALFPLYFAVTKVALTLAVILIAIPLICRFLPADRKEVASGEVSSCIVMPIPSGANRSEALLKSAAGFVGDFARDFWYISRMTVPMMFIAGFLGAVLATLIPFSAFADLPANLFVLLMAAIVGVLAPVPMAFDVVLAAILMASGVPMALVMTLLFTLGSYSIYSFIVVSRTISLKIALLLTSCLILVGVLGGLGVGAYDKWQAERTLKALETSHNGNAPEPFFGLISSAMAQETPNAKMDGPALPSGFSRVTSYGKVQGIDIHASPFAKRSAAGESLFTREEAWHRGIDRPNNFGFSSMFTPFNFTPGSVSAADMDLDGDIDVLMSNIDVKPGILLFLNDGAGHFTRKELGLKIADEGVIFGAVPFDVDNDGWLDIFVQVYLAGNYVIKSEKGRFSDDLVIPVKGRDDTLLTLTAGFGDLDRDGYLDVATGNHQGTRIGRLPTSRDINRIVFNNAGVLNGERFLEINDVPGDTLSILFSDFNMDGLLDYAEANDFHQPDLFFLGDGKGNLTKITRQQNIIPATTETTMSLKSVDLNNDGKFELYMSQIAGRSDDMEGRLTLRPWSDFCKEIERADDKAACQKNIDTRSWYKVGRFHLTLDSVAKCDAFLGQEAQECRAMIVRDIAIKSDDRQICDRISDEFYRQKTFCNNWFESLPEPKGLSYDNDILQVVGRNVLLAPDGKGSFVDVTKSANAEIGGWSWDVKTFAFDNGEFQDLFIFNGFWNIQDVSQSKVFMKNMGDLKFEEKTGEVGATDFGIIASAAAADYDNDGDIDLISSTQNGPLINFWNNSQAGNSVLIELRDGVGNRYGIGSKIWVTYGKENKRQIRELQLSSGFTAFDAPYAHFGLADNSEITKIEVEWSTGETTVLAGRFPANAKYRIERSSLATQ